MNLGSSAQLAGIALLNVIALALVIAAEWRVRRRKRADSAPSGEATTAAVAGPTPTPTVSLDRWIHEIEEAEERQAVAAGGNFRPRPQRVANG